MKKDQTQKERQLEFDLAVALKIAANLLAHAKSDRQMELATSHNLRLWQTVRGLGSRRQDPRLIDSADKATRLLVENARPQHSPEDIVLAVGRATALANDLSLGATVEKRRDALLSEWVASENAPPFKDWLLDRLAEGQTELQNLGEQNSGGENGASDGTRTRDLRRDRPTL